jgi:O-antigen ligase
MNPTYFGPLQLLLMPWVVYAAARARRGAGPVWWRVAPWVSSFGIVATASRGAAIGLVSFFLVSVAFLRPRARLYLAGAAAAAVLLAAAFPDAAVDAVVAWGGERRLEDQPRIDVNGELVPRSSTLHRLYVFSVYRSAAERAGAFGFGTEAVTGFPVNVPLGPIDPKTAWYLRNLDNTYILMLLRFGVVGLTFFALLGIVAAVNFGARSVVLAAPGRVFYAGMAAAIVATMLLMFGVWMPYDFGFSFLWTLGTASGLAAHADRRGVPASSSERRDRSGLRPGPTRHDRGRRANP